MNMYLVCAITTIAGDLYGVFAECKEIHQTLYTEFFHLNLPTAL